MSRLSRPRPIKVLSNFCSSISINGPDQNRLRRAFQQRLGVEPPRAAPAESAQASAEKYSGLLARTVKPYHGSTEAIANDPDVALVAVSVKTPQHKAAVAPAIAAGKDVFVEWPLGRNLQESIELADAARQKGVRSLVGLQSIFVDKGLGFVRQDRTGSLRELGISSHGEPIVRPGLLTVDQAAAKPAEIPVWVPFNGLADEYALDPNNGATLLSVFMGHGLNAITYALGPLSSVSATSAQIFKEIRIVGYDGEPTGETRPSLLPDQWGLTGILRDSGAILTASWRSGGTATKETDKARPTLVWLIEGEEGHIRVESTAVFGSALNMAAAHKVILNGEEVDVPDHELGNTGLAWLEFAKGKDGHYPSFDDAVDLYKHLDAIERSAKEGCTVQVDI